MKNTAQRLRVAEGRGEKAPPPKRTVPCMQTTWPHMLFPRIAATVPLVFPFDQPGLRYRYFARNAVWDAVRLLGLSGKRVLMPAYHGSFFSGQPLALGEVKVVIDTRGVASNMAEIVLAMQMRKHQDDVLEIVQSHLEQGPPLWR